MYNIFQPILKVDQEMNAQVNTYEMLIRNSSGAFPGMDFLHSLATEEGNEKWIAVSRRSLDEALEGHHDYRIYINLEPCQLKFESVWHFLAEMRAKYPKQVAVEITERREKVHDLEYLDDEIDRLSKMGFKIAIDDVSAGSNSYEFVVRQLSAIKRIKLSLLLFKDEDEKIVVDFIRAWYSFATRHHLDFVLEGISDKKIAEKFAGKPMVFQQGYYWGKGSRYIKEAETIPSLSPQS